MVARSLLVLTTGRLFCSRYTDVLPVRIVRCPVAFPPLAYYQLWHERSHASAAMRWLREQVRDAARSLSARGVRGDAGTVRTGPEPGVAQKPPALPQPLSTMTSSAPEPRTAHRLVIRGDLLDFTATPGWGEVDSDAVRFRPDHWLLIEDGGIRAVVPPIARSIPTGRAPSSTTTAAGCCCPASSTPTCTARSST